MHFIDTHTHLYLKEFDNDRDKVIERALSVGVKHMLLPNIDSSSIAGMLKMVDNYPGICFPMTGLHPTSVKDDFEKEISVVHELLTRQKFIAIGETGIDLYWDKTFKSQQIEAFTQQINWAKEYNLPLVIHARESLKEIFDILDKLHDNKLRGVFHSFSGDSGDAAHVMEYDFFVGINGIITFKNSGLEPVVKNIKPERVLLETDSPFLSPVPKRGTRNESAYIKYVAEKLALIYGLSLKEMAGITSENARKLFNI